MKTPKTASKKTGRWTIPETKKLRKIYGSKTKKDLVRILGRSIVSIESQAKRWQLAKDKVFVKRHFGAGVYKMPNWTSEEFKLLRKIYKDLPNLEVARRLQRSIGSVVSQANQLGLYKSAKRIKGMGQENIRGRWDTPERQSIF